MFPLDSDHGRCKGLDADFTFGSKAELLTVFNDSISAHTVSEPYHSGQTGDFKAPASGFKGQHLVVAHVYETGAVVCGQSDHFSSTFHWFRPFCQR